MSYLSKSFSILPRNSSRPIPPSVQNHRNQATKLPQLSSTSSTPSQKPELLSQLKSRKKTENFEITPIYAAQVVKKYLLPMFDKKKSKKSDFSRKQMMGLVPETIPTRESTTESSVLGELQLSDQLLRELESNLIVLNEAEVKVKRCEQEKFELKAEISRLFKENEELRTNMQGLIMQTNAGSKSTQTYEMIVYMLKKQLENYKKLYKTNEFKLEQVSQMLSEERSTNDIRLLLNISLTTNTSSKLKSLEKTT